MIVWRPRTAHALRRDGGWPRLKAEVERLRTVEEVDAFWSRYLLYRHRHYPESWSLLVKDLCAERRDELEIGDNLNRDLDRQWSFAMERDL